MKELIDAQTELVENIANTAKSNLRWFKTEVVLTAIMLALTLAFCIWLFPIFLQTL